MNALPSHRSAQTGRTFDRSWTASDFDPIQRPHRPHYSAADFVIAAMFVAFLVSIILWS